MFWALPLQTYLNKKCSAAFLFRLRCNSCILELLQNTPWLFALFCGTLLSRKEVNEMPSDKKRINLTIPDEIYERLQAYKNETGIVNDATACLQHLYNSWTHMQIIKQSCTFCRIQHWNSYSRLLTKARHNFRNCERKALPDLCRNPQEKRMFLCGNARAQRLASRPTEWQALPTSNGLRCQVRR